jgi:hypothetical protein
LTGIHTLTFIGRAELGERLYQHAHAIRSRIADAPAPRGRPASADLFGQGDDDARGAAEVAEPEDALVLRHLAEEFGAVGAQAGDGVVDLRGSIIWIRSLYPGPRSRRPAGKPDAATAHVRPAR